MKKIIRIKTLLILLFVFGVAFLYVQNATYRSVGSFSAEQNFRVETGDDLVTVAQNLEKRSIITQRTYFLYYFWRERLRGKLVAGDYNIVPGMTIPDIAHIITTGAVQTDDVKVTFPEGWTVVQMAQRLEQNNLPAQEFATLALEPSREIINQFSFIQEGTSSEGYLFPDTYIFAPDADAHDIIEKMLINFDQRVTQELRTEITRQGKDLHEVITLASIVEGEVRSEQDRRIVAGLFWTRLSVGQALQSDATVKYVLGINKIQHSAEDISVDSPYNTYKYPGLPPGPVSNPSLQSINATIYPIPTDYNFFLSNPQTGETVFAQTFEEHVLNKGRNGL